MRPTDRSGDASDRARRRDAPSGVPGRAHPSHRRRPALLGLRPPRPGRCDRVPRRVAAYATAHPEREWITGERLVAARVSPRRAATASCSMPSFPTVRSSCTATTATSAGPTRGLSRRRDRSRDARSADGRIVRDAEGEPTGTLHDGAIDLVSSHAAQADALRPARGAARGPGPAPCAGHHRLAGRRSSSPMCWPRTARPPRPAGSRRASSRRSGGGTRPDSSRSTPSSGNATQSAVGRLRADSVKLMLDGILESRTAFMTSPYVGEHDGASTEVGIPFFDPELLREAVIELDRRGFQAHFHAIGDGAVRLALDVVEAAGRPTARPTSAITSRTSRSSIPTTSPASGGSASSPTCSRSGRRTTIRCGRCASRCSGPDRVGWQYPFASLLRTGARLAGGSDWTVSTANPLLEIEVAVTRVAPDTRDVAPFLPDERLTLDAALRAFTSGSAYVNHLDAETGTIEVGKLADLVVLDRERPRRRMPGRSARRRCARRSSRAGRSSAPEAIACGRL